MVRFPQEETGKMRKLSRPWHGPYRVTHRIDPDLTVCKVYFAEHGPIRIHQSRVVLCPPDFPSGFYWYGKGRHSPGRPPKWVAALPGTGHPPCGREPQFLPVQGPPKRDQLVQPVEESPSGSFDAAMPFMDKATPSSETVSDAATPSSNTASEEATPSPVTEFEITPTSEAVLTMEEADGETGPDEPTESPGTIDVPLPAESRPRHSGTGRYSLRPRISQPHRFE